MQTLSKSKIVAHRQCPKRLWLQQYRPELEPVNEDLQAIFQDGFRVGAIACQQHPKGIMLPENFDEALACTPELIAKGDRPLFEATFCHQGVRVRADILEPTGTPRQKAWRMIEVKSTSSVKDYQREDVAIQAWVIQQCGVQLSEVALAHVDTSFVYPGGNRYKGFLAEEDLSLEARERMEEVPAWADAAFKTLRKRKEPSVEPGEQCTSPFPCPFSGYCSPSGQEKYPVELLPGKQGKALAAQLRQEGYGDLRKVPVARMTTDKLREIHRATARKRVFVDQAAQTLLEEHPWPHYYIDFETINPCVPIWEGTRPFEQIPFQWSCDVDTCTGRLKHHEYLADGRTDPRREFIEQLLSVLGNKGTVYVYGIAAEGSILRKLAERFPDLAEGIQAVLDRIVDLLPIARKHYYHRDQLGDWSIKAVLRTIAPDLAYDNLPIGHGRAAMTAFAKSLQPEISDEERRLLRQDLLRYCGHDTLAMLTLVQYFKEI